MILIVGLIAGSKLNSLFNNQDVGIQTSQSTTATMVKNLEKVDEHVFLNVGLILRHFLVAHEVKQFHVL